MDLRSERPGRCRRVRRSRRRALLAGGLLLAALTAAFLRVPPAAASETPPAVEAAVEAAPRPAAALPPPECVRLLRRARIAHLAGDPAAELATLRTAAETFPDEVGPVYALLQYHRDHGLPEEERLQLRERLRRRLADAARPLPVGVLQQVVDDPDAEESLLQEMADHVARRLAAPGADPDALLPVLAGFEMRLGRREEAVATLEQLWRRSGAEEVAWALLGLYGELERWPRALALMESVPALREGSMHLSYTRILIKAGRLEDARRELERLLAELDRSDLDAAAWEAGVLEALRRRAAR